MILTYTPELDMNTLYAGWLWRDGRRIPQPEIEQAINRRINFRIGQAFEQTEGSRG